MNACASVSGNKIAVIENLAATQDQFDSIDLSDNEIHRVECMAILKRLTQLLLNNNRVTRIADNLGQVLPKLDSLILTNNLIATLKDLEPLANATTLTRLSLVDNPVSKVTDYRPFVIALLPKLKVLDFQRVKLAERHAAEAKFRKLGQPKALRGVGGRGGDGSAGAGTAGAAGAAASEGAVAPPNEEQVQQIKIAIGAAASLEEVQKLEKALKAGQYDVIARAAEAAAAKG